jgi:hypothetical protein
MARVVAAPRPARVAAASLLWVLAGCIVFVWKIGPVIATLTRTHGIHSGDLFAVPVLALGALLWVTDATAWASRRALP